MFIMAIVTFSIYSDELFISINMLILGCFLVPIIPISINFSSELTFPIEATVITGTLMMVGQLGGFMLALIIGFVCDAPKNAGGWVWVFFAGLGVIGCICSVVIQEDLRKTNFSAVKVVHIATDREDEVNVFNEQTIDID